MTQSASQPAPDGYTLILGGSSRIGQLLIRRLCSANGKVVAHCHTGKDRLTSLALPPDLLSIVTADLTSPADTASLLQSIADTHGTPQALVYLPAPRLRMVRFSEFTQEDLAQNLAIQVTALSQVLQAFLPAFAKRRSGKAVIMLSSAVLGSPPGSMAPYVTAKFAAYGLLRAAASEYASRNVQINAVSPSMADTDFLQHVPPRIVEIAKDLHPLKRLATPDDIVAAILFLLSQSSNYMTGVNIPVTGSVI